MFTRNETTCFGALLAISGGLYRHLLKFKRPKIGDVFELWPIWLEEYAKLKRWTDSNATKRRMALGRKYVFPIVGQLRPSQITPALVVKSLELANSETKQTQDKVLTALSQFLRWCDSKGYRDSSLRLPTDKALLEPFLQLAVIGGHHPAVDWRDMPRFVKELVKDKNYPSAQALLFTILTVSRSQPTRMAIWQEINFQLAEWDIPAAHMKGKQGNNRPHDVPLSKQALALLKELNKKQSSGLIFSYKGAKLSEATMRKRLRIIHERLEGRGDQGFRDPSQGNRVAVPHGFRAAFATWAQETGEDINVVERCLAHVDSSDKYNGAYRRGTQVKQRRKLLQKWADYCYSKVNERSSSELS